MSDLRALLRTTQKYIDILAANNIKTPKDLLEYFPRTYEDREHILNLSQLEIWSKESVAVKGFITEKKFIPRWRKHIYDITFIDELWHQGKISIFNSGFLASKIEKEKRYIIIWKPQFKYGKFVFSHPEVSPAQNQESNTPHPTSPWSLPDGQTGRGEVSYSPSPANEVSEQGEGLGWGARKAGGNSYNAWRIYPVYSELSGIKPSRFAKKLRTILPEIPNYFHEYLPQEFLEKFNLMSVQDTIKNMHYPQNQNLNKQAKYRVFFDRLLRIQLYSLLNKREYQKGDITNNNNNNNHNITHIPQQEIDREIIKEILAKLPFELTTAQKKALKTIIENFHEEKPMLRLLQGDVGSGKTIVAAIAARYIFKKFNGQSVFLAPLEVLANQHFKNLAKLFLPLGLRIELLTWAIPPSQKEKIKEDLKNWKIDIIVGTHAVLQDDIQFHNLQYAIVDEQHKFGVKQRAFFHKFGSPHILQMTATPIPRSMALAFFWEFEVSIIDELPAGRKPIQTKIINEKEYEQLKHRILAKIQQKQKVFIVTPLIEESEKLDDLKSALTEYQAVKELFPEIVDRVWLMHGKIKSKEKEQIMQDFKGEKYDILVSTTVIEVGVDIPDATIMVIKNAERFGLSQLHQLRGRIGRNSLQSYCFLETKKKSGDSYERLQHMEYTNDGFKLAELDLQNRGAGEILGTMQSGETDIPREILTDLRFLEKVKEGAERLFEHYPWLEWLGNIKNSLQEKVGGMLV